MTDEERELRRRLWLHVAKQAVLGVGLALALWYGLLPLLRLVARGGG